MRSQTFGKDTNEIESEHGRDGQLCLYRRSGPSGHRINASARTPSFWNCFAEEVILATYLADGTANHYCEPRETRLCRDPIPGVISTIQGTRLPALRGSGSRLVSAPASSSRQS